MPEYTVYLTMAVRVEADDDEGAARGSWAEAAAKLDSQGIGCLSVSEIEEDEDA